MPETVMLRFSEASSLCVGWQDPLEMFSRRACPPRPTAPSSCTRRLEMTFSAFLLFCWVIYGKHMPIMFNSLLDACGIPLSEVRFLRHKDGRADRGRSPYELWRDNRAQFDLYQSTQSIKSERKLRGKYWAPFLGAPTGDTLFVGLYRVGN